MEDKRLIIVASSQVYCAACKDGPFDYKVTLPKECASSWKEILGPKETLDCPTCGALVEFNLYTDEGLESEEE